MLVDAAQMKVGEHMAPLEERQVSFDLVPTKFNVVKISAKGAVSFLEYPDFTEDPHPALATSITCSIESKIRRTNYNQENPWILHRKELFLPQSDYRYERFAELTRQEEEAGLLKNPPGQKKPWEALLASKGIHISEHTLIKRGES